MPKAIRVLVCALVGLSLVLCVSVPALGLAGYGILYYARHRTSTTSTATIPPATPSPISTPTPIPLCGGPPVMHILLIGSDSRADNYLAGLADSIRVVRIDFVNVEVAMLAFPRDLYVEIPGISMHGGITHGKLNQAYFYGNPALNYHEGTGQGPGLLALTMEKNFGTHVDHYVAVNLQSFVRIIDTLGGIDIDLPYTVDGRVSRSNDPDRYFPNGSQHLNGYRTMLLARLRPNGDLERSRVQNLVLQALATKIFSPPTLLKLPELSVSLSSSVQTDLNPDHIRQLVCLASLLKSERIRSVDFPQEMFVGTRINEPILGYTFVWEADFNLLREYVDQFNNGTWPPAQNPVQ